MKIKAIVLSCLIGAVVLFMGYGYSRAESKADVTGSKMGVVSVQRIFLECKMSNKFEEETAAERNKAVLDLQRLSKEIEAEEAGLKALKAGSSDYWASMKNMLQKQGSLQAQQKVYEQQMALKYQRRIEKFYKDVLRVVNEVAKQKGLDLVFENSEPKLPSSNFNELTLTISTHKLLYSNGCLDITDEVIAWLDADN